MSDDPLEQFGPAMAALTEKQRLFVLAMAADPLGNATKWAKAAGYADIDANPRVKGHLNLHNPKVEAAILEVSRSMLATVGPALATAGMIRLARNPKHPAHARAVEMLANRVGLHEVQEIHVKRSDETAEAKVARIRQMAEMLGIDPAQLLGVNVAEKPQKMIDVTPEKPDGASNE